MFANAARILKPRQNGDFALLMILSLNLLMLVFFMLLNSMATPGKPHPEAQLKRDQGVPLDADSAVSGLNVPLAPIAAWRESVITRLRGTILNRLEMEILPQGSNASELLVEIPLTDVFLPNGKLRRPEFVQAITRAAGNDSTVAWTLLMPVDDKQLANSMATLSRLARTTVAWVEGSRNVLQLRVVPGSQTDPSMGRAMQNLGEQTGGTVTGVDAGSVR